MKRLLIVLTIVLVIAAGVSGWWWVRSSLPILDGQLQYPALTAPVEVIFDAHGVPSVYAYDIEDAWFTAGVLHARDRRWQMELYRRVTMGRLSEVLGDTTIPFDQRFLTLGLRDAANAEWERAAPQVKQALERYAAGVNATTATMVGRMRPIEFQLLGITPPEWEPIDSLAVGRLLTWRLAENHQAELVRGALAAKFGESSRATADRCLSVVGAVDPANRASSRRRCPRRLRPNARPLPPASNGCRRVRGAATATTGCWPAAAPRAGGRSSRTIRICRSSSRPSGTRCISSRPVSM